MDKETKEMFELVLDKLGGIDNRLGGLETRMDRIETKVDKLEIRIDGLESEFKEFRLDMKEEHKRTDAKIDLIYNKLTNGIEEIKNKPEPKFKIVREL